MFLTGLAHRKPGWGLRRFLAAAVYGASEPHRQSREGGAKNHEKDAQVFGNREYWLPHQVRGYYRKYEVFTPKSCDRGTRLIVCGGPVATSFNARYDTDDHCASFRLIALVSPTINKDRGGSRP